LRDVNSAL